MIGWILGGIGGLVGITVISSIRIISEYEKAIVLRLGQYRTTLKPGIYLVAPFIDSVLREDMRLRTMDIEEQETITKDNISVKIDAVVFFRIIDVKKVLLQVKNYESNVRQQSLAVLRDVVGEYTLDSLLENKDKMSKSIKEQIDKVTEKWGVDIEQVKLQNIELPEDMKRIMARVAEAEREGKAVEIKAKSELKASSDLTEAAKKLAETPGAMQLRVLSTISDVSQDQSNTLVFALPWEVLKGNGAALTAAGLSHLASRHPAEVKTKEIIVENGQEEDQEDYEEDNEDE